MLGNNLTLTANNVTDSDGTVDAVAFYRDTNGNGSIDVGTDELFGALHAGRTRITLDLDLDGLDPRIPDGNQHVHGRGGGRLVGV